MTRALDRLHRERAVLRARSGMERRRIEDALARLAPALRTADRTASVAGRALRSPLGWLGAAGLLSLLRPRRVLKKAAPLLAAWRLWRALRPLVRALRRQAPPQR